MVELQLSRRLGELGEQPLVCPVQDEGHRQELAAHAKVFADNTSAAVGSRRRPPRSDADTETLEMSRLGSFAGEESDSDTEQLLIRHNPLPPADAGWWHRTLWGVKQQCLRASVFIGEDWLALAVLGMCTALMGFLLDALVKWMLSLRTQIGKHSSFSFFLLWTMYTVAGVAAALAVMRYIARNAEGSGIPQMKTILKGFSSYEYLSARTFVAKLIGLVFAEGSGLPIGKEGPFVHLASIIAEQLGRKVPIFQNLVLNESRRLELLSAACAVGVASNFAAPIGGVLFSIEVTATYFAVRNYWRGFFASVMGAFVFRLLAVVVSNERTITALFTTKFDEYPFDLEEMIAFVAVGLLCGLGGALFVFLHRKIIELKHLRSQPGQIFECLRYHWSLYPLACSALIAVFTFPGFLGRFMGMTQTTEINHLFTSRPLQCVEEWSTSNIFLSLSIFLLCKFCFTAVAVGFPIPAGVFVPVFVAGAAFGRIVGEAMAVWFPQGFRIDTADITPSNVTDICSPEYTQRIAAGGYAVVGAAALAGAVTQTISTSVIVFELTGQIQHILPVMMAVLLSIAICQKLSPSLYDSIIQIKGLPYLPDLRKGSGYKLLVSDIMKKDMFYVSLQSTYARIADVLSQTDFRVFPLVDSPDTQILVGSIARTELEHMLKVQLDRTDVSVASDIAAAPPSPQVARANQDAESVHLPNTPLGASVRINPAGEVMWQSTDRPATGANTAVTARLSAAAVAAPEELTRIALLRETANFKNARVDPSPFQLVEHTSLYKVHTLFSLLGITLAYVTHVGRLVGVVGLEEVRAAINSAAGKRAFERQDDRLHPHNTIRFVFDDFEAPNN